VRAVVYDRYGPPEVLRLEEVERPMPAENELLVRIHATTVNRTDCGWRSAKPFLIRLFMGVLRPKQRILGMELAGEVEGVGSSVTQFAVGDRVFGVKGFGAHAELVCIREGGPVAHMPAGISYEEAAAVCDGVCIALSCLRKTELGPGRSILVYGASGSVGTAAVQLAKHFGADVTAVCDTKNVELVRSLGAGRVLDYTREDFTRDRVKYDIVFDAVGKQTYMRIRRSLKPGGIYIATDGFRNIFLAPWIARLGGKRAKLGIAKYTKTDVLFLKELLETRAYRPVIDRSYALQDVVEATRYVETGMKTGNVVLTVNGGPAR
jgi:NADPH:quinone reductase-like Zn-dependent oxidoreductase